MTESIHFTSVKRVFNTLDQVQKGKEREVRSAHHDIFADGVEGLGPPSGGHRRVAQDPPLLLLLLGEPLLLRRLQLLQLLLHIVHWRMQMRLVLMHVVLGSWRQLREGGLVCWLVGGHLLSHLLLSHLLRWWLLVVRLLVLHGRRCHWRS